MAASRKRALPAGSDWVFPEPSRHKVVDWFLSRHPYFVHDVLRIVVFGFAGFTEGRWTLHEAKRPSDVHSCICRREALLHSVHRLWSHNISHCVGVVPSVRTDNRIATLLNHVFYEVSEGCAHKIVTEQHFTNLIRYAEKDYGIQGPAVFAAAMECQNNLTQLINVRVDDRDHGPTDTSPLVYRSKVIVRGGNIVLMAARGTEEIGLLVRHESRIEWVVHRWDGATTRRTLVLPMPMRLELHPRADTEHDHSGLVPTFVNNTISFVHNATFVQYDWDGECLLTVCLPYPRRPFHRAAPSSDDASAFEWRVDLKASGVWLDPHSNGLRVQFDCERTSTTRYAGGNYKAREDAEHECWVRLQ